MTFSAEFRSVMVFLVFVTGEAALTCGHLPSVRGMAAGTGKGGVLVYFVKARDVGVA